jgi:hypothetical protein
MADYYRELVSILRKNGYQLPQARQATKSGIGQRVTAPRTTKSPHAANHVLKQAGLPKAF